MRGMDQKTKNGIKILPFLVVPRSLINIKSGCGPIGVRLNHSEFRTPLRRQLRYSYNFMPRFHRRHGRKKKHVFSKRAEKAIKRIAQEPVETKWHIDTEDLATRYIPSTYVAGQQSRLWVHNVFQFLPKDRTGGLPTPDPRDTVIGNEFRATGVSVKWRFAYPAPFIGGVTAGTQHLMRVRITMFKMVDYSSTAPSAGSPFQGSTWVNTTPTFYAEEDSDQTPTFFRFDMDKVTVMKSKSFTLSSGGQRSFLAEGKMWVPFQKKMVIWDSESSTSVNRLKDWNYYLLLEIYDPFVLIGDTGNNANWDLQMEEKVYYKDA